MSEYPDKIKSSKPFRPPEGYEYTGEYRKPEAGDLFQSYNGRLCCAQEGGRYPSPRYILREVKEDLPQSQMTKRSLMEIADELMEIARQIQEIK